MTLAGQSDTQWSASMVRDALDAVRSEMGEVFVNWHDELLERELLMARYYVDRARALANGLDPAVVDLP